jgi:hypothetical protein
MLSADALVDAAREETGLDDFGAGSFLDGLARLTDALSTEADLTPLGEGILAMRLRGLLASRLRIEDTYRVNPEIASEVVEGPVFIVGLPRTGTTALSQLLALDPQIRSLRVWESGAPVPPPEASTEHDDPRIAETARGLDAMYQTFPRMLSLHFITADGPAECQDLLGMSFRTAHFDGMAHVPSYTDWVMSCDMAPAYAYHRRTLQLLQWHCPPRLWHLKTPVHLLALDDVVTAYPDARFLWTHRDPAAVMGSVCDLIAYTRSWVSDRDDSRQLGRQQLGLWSDAIGRGMAFRDASSQHRFADVAFDQLNDDPVATVSAAYEQIGLELSDAAATLMRNWSQQHAKGAHGVHEYGLDDWGLDAATVRAEFATYCERFLSPGFAAG